MNVLKTTLGVVSTTQVLRLLVRVIFWVLDILCERRREARAQARATARWSLVRRAWTITFHGGTCYLAHNGEPVCPLHYKSIEELNDFLYECWSKHFDDFK